MDVSNFTNPLDTIQIISIFSHLTTLSDVLFAENFLKSSDQHQQIPVVNALHHYLVDKTGENVYEKKLHLVRKLLHGTDLYGAKEDENPDPYFVHSVLNYITESLVFEKYGSVHGFIAHTVRSATNESLHSLLSRLQESLQLMIFDNENGQTSKLDPIVAVQIFQNSIQPLFPSSENDISILSTDFVHAQAGVMFLRSGPRRADSTSGMRNWTDSAPEVSNANNSENWKRSNTNNSEDWKRSNTNNSEDWKRSNANNSEDWNRSNANTTEVFRSSAFGKTKKALMDKFQEQVETGIAIESLVAAGQVPKAALKIFALPALITYMYKEKDNFGFVRTLDIVSSPVHWEKAYEHLFTWLNNAFTEIEKSQEEHYRYQFYLALSSYKNRTTLARETIKMNCLSEKQSSGDHPEQGIGNPKQGIDHPGQGIGNREQGIGNPKQEIDHPQQGMDNNPKQWNGNAPKQGNDSTPKEGIDNDPKQNPSEQLNNLKQLNNNLEHMNNNLEHMNNTPEHEIFDLEQETTIYKNNPKTYKCKNGNKTLDDLNTKFYNLVNNITQKYFNFEKESCREAFGDLSKNDVIISKGLFRKFFYLTIGFNTTQTKLIKQSDDFFEFYFPDNKTYEYYALIRTGYNVKLVKITEKPDQLRRKLLGRLGRLRSHLFARVMKQRDESFDQFLTRLAEEKAEDFKSNLETLGYDQTRSEWWKELGLALIPFYTCVNSIKGGKKVSASIACSVDVVLMIPVIGTAASVSGKLASAVSKSVLTLSHTTLETIALRATIRSTLQITGKVLAKEVAQFIALFQFKTFQGLGTSVLRLVDPGFELVHTIGKGGIRSIQSLINLVEKKYPISFQTVKGMLKSSENAMSHLPMKVGTMSGKDVLVNTLSDGKILKGSGFGVKVLGSNKILDIKGERVLDIKGDMDIKDNRVLDTKGSDDKILDTKGSDDILHTKGSHDKILDTKGPNEVTDIESLDKDFVGNGFGYKYVRLGSGQIAEIRTVPEFQEELAIVLTRMDKDRKLYRRVNMETEEMVGDEFYIDGGRTQPRPDIFKAEIDICEGDCVDGGALGKGFREIKTKNQVLKEIVEYGVKKEKLPETEIRKVLKRYSFPESEQELNFVKEWLENLVPPTWADKFRIEEPDLFFKLKYKEVMESPKLTIEEATRRIENLYRPFEAIEAELPLEEVLKDFKDKGVYNQATFEDYYALRYYGGSGYVKMAGNSDEAKRMKNAIYRLAIRQSEDPTEPFARTLFRGEWRIPEAIEKELSDEGKRLEFNRFTSVSTDIDIAIKYSMSDYPTMTRVLYEMKFENPIVRARVEHLFVKNEKETILLPGTKFRIDKLERSVEETKFGIRQNNIKVVMTHIDDATLKVERQKSIMKEIKQLMETDTKFYHDDLIS